MPSIKCSASKEARRHDQEELGAAYPTSRKSIQIPDKVRYIESQIPDLGRDIIIIEVFSNIEICPCYFN